MSWHEGKNTGAILNNHDKAAVGFRGDFLFEFSSRHAPCPILADNGSGITDYCQKNGGCPMFLGAVQGHGKNIFDRFWFFFNFHLTISNNFNRLSGTRARRQKNLKQFKKRSKMIVICEKLWPRTGI